MYLRNINMEKHDQKSRPRRDRGYTDRNRSKEGHPFGVVHVSRDLPVSDPTVCPKLGR